MEKQVMRVLNKLYNYQNKYCGKNQEDLYSETVLSEKETALLLTNGWKVNEIEHFTGHDDAVQKLLSLKHNPMLNETQIVKAFIAGVGGSYLRGRSALSSWYCLNTIQPHAYHERAEYKCCWICGEEDKKSIINDSEFQYIMYLGNAFASSPIYAYLNLKYLSEQIEVSPTTQDIKVFSRLIELLRTAPADETPGKCEKRLRAAKFLPATQHIQGILYSLALVGVIPNKFISLSDHSHVDWGDITICERQLKNTAGRSDMEMPWAGWHGSLKINEENTDRLFGKYLKTVVI